MFGFRALRRRWFLAFFIAGFILFVIYSTLDKTDTDVISTYEIQHSLLRQPFQWQPVLHDVGSNTSSILQCRNSIQGKQLLVDERGYVCERSYLTSGGCCDTKISGTTQYNCSTCKSNGCCVLYEHCVSCCLQPEKQAVLQRILQQAREIIDKVYIAVTDQFELCLAKCRTSSLSVQHENSYRDPRSKHCYGEDPPDLQMVVT